MVHFVWDVLPRDYAVVRVQTAERRPLFELRGHRGEVHALAWSGDGRVMATASGDGVRVWDGTDGRALTALRGASLSVALSADGGTLVVGLSDRTVRVWRGPPYALALELRGHTGAVYGVAVSPDGALVASGASDDLVCLWDGATGALLHTLRGHGEDVRCVALAAGGGSEWGSAARLVSAGVDKWLCVWDCATGACLFQLRPPERKSVSRLALTASGRAAASSCFHPRFCSDRTVCAWDLVRGTLIRVVRDSSVDEVAAQLERDEAAGLF